MPGLRERLMARTLPSEPYEMRVAPTQETRRAEEELSRAQRRVSVLESRSDPDAGELRTARRRSTEAQQRRDACYEQVVLTALPPEAFEELQDQHPEVESGDKKEKRAQDTAFSWQMFLACAPSEEMSEEDWRYVVYQTMSQGERLALFNSVFELNLRGRAPSKATPKD